MPSPTDVSSTSVCRASRRRSEVCSRTRRSSPRRSAALSAASSVWRAPTATISTSHVAVWAPWKRPPVPKPTGHDRHEQDAEDQDAPARVGRLALRALREPVDDVARHPRGQADGEVAGDPAEVERRAEAEAALLGEHREGEVADRVQDEAGGHQREDRPVRAAGAQHQQQGDGGQHDVQRREDQRDGRGGSRGPPRRAAGRRPAPRR